jgi:hypothetical protein
MKIWSSAAVAIVSTAGFAASVSFADVVEIGPFVGERYENFENLAPPGGYPGPYAIFGGAATINDSLANTFVIATNMSSAESGWVNFFPYEGFLMGLIPTGWTVFTFDPPVTRFGGYIGTSAIPPGGTVTFKDAGGAIIGTLPISVASMQWNWHGWQSSVPIARVEIVADPNPGRPLCFDAMYLSVAAPCYANCDGSTASPVLNVADFSCFLGKYANGDTYANCDGSTAAPTLNVSDFTCFLQKYASGCP